MSELDIARIIMVGKLHEVFCAAAVVGVVLSSVLLVVLLAMGSACYCEDETRHTRMALALSLAIVAASAAGYVLTPSLREAAAIKVIPAICGSEDVGDISAAAKTLALEWLETLRPAAGEEKGGAR